MEYKVRGAARQAARCDEHNPSRRSSASTSPGFVHRSASSSTLRLYTTVNRRHWAFVTTSTSCSTLPSTRSPVIVPCFLALHSTLNLVSFSHPFVRLPPVTEVGSLPHGTPHPRMPKHTPWSLPKELDCPPASEPTASAAPFRPAGHRVLPLHRQTERGVPRPRH